jgi:hypothetical protein
VAPAAVPSEEIGDPEPGFLGVLAEAIAAIEGAKVPYLVIGGVDAGIGAAGAKGFGGRSRGLSHASGLGCSPQGRRPASREQMTKGA